ncbi:MAG: hypothetical protein Q8L40_11555, partial [Burkholderiales bacterium]|nr:hypothetical protein [Burkholderiales bacterium]
LAGLIAAAGANTLGAVLASRILNLGFSFNVTVWVAGIVFGAVGVAAAGHLGTRKMLRTAPLQSLRNIG